MTAPSNANTSGLGDVGLSETYRFAYESIRNGAPGLSDATCAAIARSINMKVSLAANYRATAAEARADGLAKAGDRLVDALHRYGFPVSGGARVALTDRGSNEAVELDEAASNFRAALQQETQP